MLKVSIVTVTYNSSPQIGNLLSSIAKYAPHCEIIIIENQSPDAHKTKAVCESFLSKLNLKFYVHENSGFGAGCNFGVSKAHNDLILFLNPDTEITANSIDVLVKHKSATSAHIIAGKALDSLGMMHGSIVRYPDLFIGLFEFSNLGKLLHISNANRYFYYLDINISDIEVDKEVQAVSGAYLLIDKDSFVTLSGFDEKFFMYLEDIDICLRAKKAGMKICFCPHSTINHIGGASSLNKYKTKLDAWYFSRRYYFSKHSTFLVNLLIQPVFTIEEFLLKLRSYL